MAFPSRRLFSLAPAALVLVTGFALASPLVAVDVGHSHGRPGATSARGIAEFEFNRRLAQALLPILAARNVRTIAIGLDGNADSLTARTQEADRAGADLFVSLHHDSAQPQFLQPLKDGRNPAFARRFSGFSLFVSHDNVDLDASLKCANSIGAALLAAGLHPSTYHAESIPGEGYRYADEAHGVFFHDQLSVLHTGHQAALLLEAGVIVNPSEEARLSSPGDVQLIARAVATGIVECQIKK